MYRRREFQDEAPKESFKEIKTEKREGKTTTGGREPLRGPKCGSPTWSEAENLLILFKHSVPPSL